jgi:hypothetical protein
MERGRGAHLQVTVTASESRKRWPSSVLMFFYAWEGRNEEFLRLGGKTEHLVTTKVTHVKNPKYYRNRSGIKTAQRTS